MIERAPPYLDQDPLKVLKIIAAKCVGDTSGSTDICSGTPALKHPERSTREVKAFLAACLCVDVRARASTAELLRVRPVAAGKADRQDQRFFDMACSRTRLLDLLRPKGE